MPFVQTKGQVILCRNNITVQILTDTLQSIPKTDSKTSLFYVKIEYFTAFFMFTVTSQPIRYLIGLNYDLITKQSI